MILWYKLKLIYYFYNFEVFSAESKELQIQIKPAIHLIP
jgi:hypothetical protein